MFFGAGNIVFPMKLGIEHQSQYIWAFLGLLFTAIGGPLIGLLAGTLLEGNCKKFFFGGGAVLGVFLLTLTIVMEAFIATPRCYPVSYAAFAPLVSMPLWSFSIIFSIISLLCCWKHEYILPILGKILSPILLFCLFTIIYQSWMNESVIQIGSSTPFQAFTSGLKNGYFTMDLIASIYFSAGIWILIKLGSKSTAKQTLKTTLISGVLGCAFLAIIYFGLCFSAAKFNTQLSGVASEYLLSQLALIVLGPNLYIIANLAVCLACLTSVISLVMAVSDVMCIYLFKNKISYHTVIILNLVVATVMAQMGFQGLLDILKPIIYVSYPIIILLAIKAIYGNFFKKIKNL